MTYNELVAFFEKYDQIPGNYTIIDDPKKYLILIFDALSISKVFALYINDVVFSLIAKNRWLFCFDSWQHLSYSYDRYVSDFERNALNKKC